MPLSPRDVLHNFEIFLYNSVEKWRTTETRDILYLLSRGHTMIKLLSNQPIYMTFRRIFKASFKKHKYEGIVRLSDRASENL